MRRIYGDRITLLAYLIAQWAGQQLQIPHRLRTPLRPWIRLARPER
jgi:hypothetical protein